MAVLRSRSVGFVALSAALALFSGKVALGLEAAAGGGSNTVAPCVDDVGIVAAKAIPTKRKLAASCVGSYIGDGDCDLDNNTEECGYDGGDCCECTCESTEEYTCGDNGEYDCVDPSSLCAHVEVGTKTSVTVTANAYDTRDGNSSGCGTDGCTPALSRDEESDEDESRWSCSQKIVADGSLCEITFTFGEPQDIKGAQIAFLNGDDRTRSVEAMVNGVAIGDFDSYPGSTFNSLAISGDDVSTLTLKSIGIEDDDWISLVEVRFLVEP